MNIHFTLFLCIGLLVGMTAEAALYVDGNGTTMSGFMIFVKQLPGQNPCYLPCQSRSLDHTGYMLPLKLRLKNTRVRKRRD
jgi:hypothetical protein